MLHHLNTLAHSKLQKESPDALCHLYSASCKRKMMQIYVFSSHPEISLTCLLFCIVKRFLVVTKPFVVSTGSLGTNSKYSLRFFSCVRGVAFSSLKRKDFIPKHSSATLQNRDVGQDCYALLWLCG